VLPNHLSNRNDVPTESVDDETDGVIDVSQAIERAERILPGQAAAEGESDPRWQAIMLIEDFIEEEPDSIWPFILRWGVNHDEDLRTAIGVLLLEDLLEHHFARFFPLVEEATRRNSNFANTFRKCWKLGQAAENGNAEAFDALQSQCRNVKRH
jgi:hypothetical protein